MKLSSNYGAFVTSSSGARNNKYFIMGMPVGISLKIENDADVMQTTRISVCKGAKFALSSLAIDTPFFGPLDQVKLMARFISGDVMEEGKEWICLSNFLGKERGGQAVPNSCPLNLEAIGPCVVELSARGFLDGGSVEVVGNLVASDGAPPPPVGQEAASLKEGVSKGSSKGRFFKGLFNTLRAQLIFVSLMVLCLARHGGGGFTRSTPSLHPTNNRKLIQAERTMVGLQNSNPKVVSLTLETSNSNPTDSVATEDNTPGLFVPPRQSTFEAQQGEAVASPRDTSGRSTEGDFPNGGSGDQLPDVLVQKITVEARRQGEAAGSAFEGSLRLTDVITADFISPVASSTRFLADECINLTIGIKAPVAFNNDFVKWWLDVITDDGNETVWSKSYDDLDLKGTIILERAREEPVCLSPGTYAFHHDQFSMFYAVSSDGVLIECGQWNPGPGIFVLPFNSSDPSTISFDEREGIWDIDDGGLDWCPNPNVTCTADEGDDACAKKALEPMYCWYSGRVKYGGNPTEWLTNTCAKIFTNACEAKSLGLEDDYIGFYHNTAVVLPMCPFFECAIPAYQSYLKGGTLEKYHGCNCHLALGECADCNEAKCCFGDSPETTTSESDIVKSCSCVIEPACEKGNADMCEISLDFCCPSKLDPVEKNTCKKTALQVTCESSIKNSTLEDYSLCHQASDAKCDDGNDAIGCKCSYWETLCTENIMLHNGSICEEAVEYCCDELSPYSTQKQCHCDFYNYVSKFGYISVEKQTSCDTALAERQGRNNMIMYEYYLEKIYYSLGGESWINSTGWLDNTTGSFCEWFGLTCDQNGFVVRIELKGNNLNGNLTYVDDAGDTLFLFNHLYELEVLDLSDNYISGQVSKQDYFNLVNLLHVDMSGNELTGVADIQLSPAIRHLNYSHNIFSSVRHLNKNYAAYESLEVIDLSDNSLEQSASTVLQKLPPNLKGLYISDNSITGTLPQPFPAVMRMEHFHASNNQLRGPLIEFSRSMPRIFTIDLSNQKHSESKGGLNGALPADIPSLLDLLELNLSGNTLTNTIPEGIGNIPRLRMLNLSHNAFSGEIPSELGQLAAVSKVLDLSSNALTGTIPREIITFRGLVLLDNNLLSSPAPLGLCYDVVDFDLKNRSEFCPPERNALQEFFISSKGQEWSNSSLWGAQFEDPCTWYGVKCDKKQVVELNLANNGLGGFLSSSIGNLSSLKMLDINDNNIKGSIPKELFALSNLTHLRLSFNQFSGTVPVQLADLTNLELAQFHSNWLTGDIYHSGHRMKDPSSFTSDCGVPSAFDSPAHCPNCTICCNLQGACHSTETPEVLIKDTDTWGFRNFEELSIVILLSIFGFFALLVPATYVFNKHFRSQSFTRSVSRALIEEEKKDAMKAMGHETVYWFFLTRYWTAWIIALSVIAFQFIVFGFFVQAAEKKFDDEKVDFVYSWRCPRNNPVCIDEDDRTRLGWVIFGILLIVFIFKDIVNGSKLVLMSTKTWHRAHRRIRFFFGGMSLILITTFAIYASTVYNYAIARTNRELVVNAVIILFISDIDEQMFLLLEAMCPNWLNSLESEVKDQSDDMQDVGNEENTDQVEPQNRETEDFHATLRKIQMETNAKLEQMEQKLQLLSQARGDEEDTKKIWSKSGDVKMKMNLID